MRTFNYRTDLSSDINKVIEIPVANEGEVQIAKSENVCQSQSIQTLIRF